MLPYTPSNVLDVCPCVNWEHGTEIGEGDGNGERIRRGAPSESLGGLMLEISETSFAATISWSQNAEMLSYFSVTFAEYTT